MKFKVIIFDFDGVLLESVDIKDYAFKTLFQDYPEHLEEIMEYHLSNNAIVRFDKFKYITEKILHKSYDKGTEKELSNIFSDLVFRRLVECPFVNGAKEILDFLQDKIPIYIASRSPADELEKILEIRKLKKYFKEIYAVPWLKPNAIRDI